MRHQLGAGAAGRAVHAQDGMARIEEAFHQRERHAVLFGKPVDGRRGFAREQSHQALVGFVPGLVLDVGSEQVRIVGDAFGALDLRPGGWDQA